MSLLSETLRFRAATIGIAFISLIFAVTAASTFVHANCFSYRLTSTTNPQFSVTAINEALDVHNDARRNVSPWAKVMPMLQWDEKLATRAHDWISTCPGMVHSSSSFRSNIVDDTGFAWSYVGENLAAGTAFTATSGLKQSSQAWAAELTANSWTHGCNPFGGSCNGAGHYTQQIWSTTVRIGCAMKECPSLPFKNYFACHYAAGGNVNLPSTQPYVKTTVASEAATCQNLGATAPTTVAPGSGSDNSSSSDAAASAQKAAMIGGIVGGVVGLVVIIVIIVFVCMKMKGNNSNSSMSEPTTTARGGEFAPSAQEVGLNQNDGWAYDTASGYYFSKQLNLYYSREHGRYWSPMYGWSNASGGWD